MVKHKSIALVAMIAVIMLSTSFAMVLLGTNGTPDEKVVARTEAAIGFTLVDDLGRLKLSSNQYIEQLSTGEEVNIRVVLPDSSSYTINTVDVVWHLETDWDTQVNVTGSTLKWVFDPAEDALDYQVNRDITVTVYDKSNHSISGTQTMEVRIYADFDADGLPDNWERKYFGSVTATDGTVDSDSDGATNLAEFEGDTDPMDATSHPPGFIETYSWLVALLAIVIVVVVLFIFILMPKMKTQREMDEKKKIAAAVEVEKSLLGLDELEETPKK
jgi:hypothetical protein